jgi:hypothetical protein
VQVDSTKLVHAGLLWSSWWDLHPDSTPAVLLGPRQARYMIIKIVRAVFVNHDELRET